MKEVFLAKTFAGFENLLQKELHQLGAKNTAVLNRSVQFEGDFNLLYRVNYASRFASRVLWQMKHFTFATNNDYYREIFDFPAEKYLSRSGTFAVSCTAFESIFKTPLFASLLTKDAICDRFRDKFGERPDVDKENPEVQFHIHIHKNCAILYLDSSGESLHKRGYKVSNHPASINEITAAAMVTLSGWDRNSDFIDPMCGGGTILIEAAMQALNIPAGYYRENYGFYKWLNFDKYLWKQTRNEFAIQDDIPIDLYGYDCIPRFLGMAKANIEKARLEDFILLNKRDMRTVKPMHTPSMIVFNPPYGERLETEDNNLFYKEIGDALKQNFSNCKAFLISSNLDALKHIGLKTCFKQNIFNGALECKYYGYDLFSGKFAPANKTHHGNYKIDRK
ncbi:MAG: class I SAM-dependent RNA methyltransferase [Bacteroidales bacterium]|jgi:putative N6-adenine-specific DNA methylase|nr:class I SAM-dependent RNA methyltransferase [Bacteroidales bacterium]